ncbi:X-ray repair cross-complementing protein 5-like isoform X2 [Aphis craccivora]|uniref:Cyclin-dependent kinases regulatory subunit n=1 Tax=Aphis craccivora TaxID=307492 RepID=A0A6G0Y2B8_APHCR|nr:X-ray repair cross-complementing protein 5-like isoform X2 [Aphis craccivora]
MTSRDDIKYSVKYEDDTYVYRHVILPECLARTMPKTHLMTETEWRNLGIQMSTGWQHYMRHGPEPHIVPFRRLKNENDEL